VPGPLCLMAAGASVTPGQHFVPAAPVCSQHSPERRLLTAGRADCGRPLRKHDSAQPVSQRPVGRTLGADRPRPDVVAQPAPRPGTGHRPTGRTRAAPDRERHPVHGPHRHPLALPAARLRPVGHGVRAFRQVAAGRRVRAVHRPAAAPGPRSRGPTRGAVVLRAGLPDHQDLRRRAPRGPGHGRRGTDHRAQASPRPAADRASHRRRRDPAVPHRRLGFDVHPDQRPPGARGFTIVPRRWTIERSIGRLMHRSKARPSERRRISSVASWCCGPFGQRTISVMQDPFGYEGTAMPASASPAGDSLGSPGEGADPVEHLRSATVAAVRAQVLGCGAESAGGPGGVEGGVGVEEGPPVVYGLVEVAES